MIKVGLLSDQVLTVVPTVGALTGSYLDGTGRVFWMGGLAILLDTSFLPPLVQWTDLPVGRMQSTGKRWGKIRDTDMFHVNATGSVVFGQIFGSGTPLVKTGYSNGRTYTTSGASITVADFATWGSDYTRRWEFSVPSRIVSGSTRGPYSQYRQIDVFFEGDFGLVIVSDGQRSDDPTEKNALVESAYGNGAVHFLRRDRVSGKVTVLTKSYTPVLKPNGNFYITIGQNQYSVGALTPSHARMIGSVSSWPIPGTYSTMTNTNLPSIASSADDAVFMFSSGYFFSAMAQHMTAFPSTFKFEELSQSIFRQQKPVDANILLTVVELVSMFGNPDAWLNLAKLIDDLRSVEFVPEILRSIKSLPDLAEHLANGSLATWYGVLPTKGDFEKVMAGLVRTANAVSGSTRYHARHSSVEGSTSGSPIFTSHVLTVETANWPRDFLGLTMSFQRSARRWGMLPSFSMLWDALPFSFVVDWVATIVGFSFGDLAERLDAVLIDDQYFDISYCIQSIKRQWRPPIDRLWPSGVSGSVVFSTYDRQISRNMPLPLSQEDEPGSPFRHFGEASALIVQRMRR